VERGRGIIYMYILPNSIHGVKICERRKKKWRRGGKRNAGVCERKESEKRDVLFWWLLWGGKIEWDWG
jgi:hypothetical protein